MSPTHDVLARLLPAYINPADTFPLGAFFFSALMNGLYLGILAAFVAGAIRLVMM